MRTTVEPGVEEVGCLTDAELADALLETDAVISAQEARRARLLLEFDGRKAWVGDGAVSAKQWLAQRCDLASRDAAARMRFTRLCFAFPASAAACDSIGTAKVRVLFSAVNRRTRAFFERDEALLLEEAAQRTVDGVERLVQEWLVRCDQEGPPPHDPQKNEVSLTSILDGRWLLRGELDAETGASLKTALQERADRIFRAQRTCPEGDQCSPSERMGEALGLLVRDATRSGVGEGDDTNTPAFTAIVDLDTIEGRIGKRCEIVGHGPITAEHAKRLMCDARINRLIMDASSAILNAGHTTYTPTRAQRRALVARDGGCGWPGCAMPPGWCDAHHIIWWGGPEQGPTDIDLLLLLCRRHHRMVHELGWTIERTDRGQVIVTRPDGTILPPPIRSMDRQHRGPPGHQASA